MNSNQMSTLPQRNVASAAGKKCYCFPNAVGTKVPLEKTGVTECIVSSLNFTNAEAILSLTENYLTEKYLAFSSVTLKALVSFMLNSTFLETQKRRVVYILDDQLRFHPGCASYMKPTYEALLLRSEDSFVGLTTMDYVLSQFEQMLSKQNESSGDNQPSNCFSTNRISRRARKQKVFFDEIETKKSKLDPELRPSTPEPVEEDPKPETNDVENLALVLNFLTDILKHELGSILSRGEDIKNSILCKLFFRFGTASCLNMTLLSKAFIAYKNCTGVAERRSLLKLIELVAEVCMLVDGEESIDLRCWKRYFGAFVNEFVGLVLLDQSLPEVFGRIVDLKPELLRYRAAHFLFEKNWEKHMSAGLKGVSRALNAVLKTDKSAAFRPENERKVLPNVLQRLDANQQPSFPGITEMIALYHSDDISALMRLSKAGIDFSAADKMGRTALHFVAQRGSLKCAEYILNNSKKRLDVDQKDYKNMSPLMYASQNNHEGILQLFLDYKGTTAVEKRAEDGRTHKKLTPSVCKLLTIVADSTIKLMPMLNADSRAQTIEYHRKLQKAAEELCSKKTVPNEMRALAFIMNRINFD